MEQEARIRRAKIVCTIGPASRDPEMFGRLVAAGMDAVRINFSHTSHDEAKRLFSMARAAAKETGRALAVIGDLQGPKIRVGNLPAPREIERGESYAFVIEDHPAPTGVADAAHLIPTTYEGLADDLGVGDRVLVDDGNLEFRVSSVRGDSVFATAVNGGSLTSQKGINLPGVQVRAPSLTEKDLEDQAFACGCGFDYLAHSFIRRPEDIDALRDVASSQILLIAKIEKDEAVGHLREIMVRADGVMVARGDLGVELPYQQVPLVQKRILRLGRELARVSITATQMLESMTHSPRPTRAEVSDVANALLDGSGAVMLSAETATGDYPVESVAAMDRIIREIEQESAAAAEAALAVRTRTVTGLRTEVSTSAAVAAAALQAALRLAAPFIVTFTRSGFTAREVASLRPAVPVLAVTDQVQTYQQLALVWGVVPIMFYGEPTYDHMLERARECAAELGLGQSGERFVVTAGIPFHVAGTTNMMRVEDV